MAALLIAAFLAPLAGRAWAEAPPAVAGADWEARLAKGKALKGESKDRKNEATATFEAAKLACQKKFRVYECHDEARERYVLAIKEARRLENEGAAIERQVKKEQLADKDQRHRDEVPQREADLKEREAAVAADQQQAAAKHDKLQAKKAQQEAEGPEKRAADDERIRLKREKHERTVAKKMEKARQREAESAPADKD